MPPTLSHGKICYLVIPAINVQSSAAFYQKVFGWKTHPRNENQIGFDDGAGQVSGMWVHGGPPVDAGFVYIMTDDLERTCQQIITEGGEIVQRPDPNAREVTARFRDPAGNLFGVYQESKLRGQGEAR